MLNRPDPSGCLLFTSFLYRSDLHSLDDLERDWQNLYGTSFGLIPQFNPLSSYYSKEMGASDLLNRFFLVSTQVFPRSILLTSKLQALEWEARTSVDGQRRINIDIGVISLENFLLATTKNYSHRIFIGDGLFADLTYEYSHGSFKELPWTYPDYKDPQKMDFMNWARSYLQIKLQS